MSPIEGEDKDYAKQSNKELKGSQECISNPRLNADDSCGEHGEAASTILSQHSRHYARQQQTTYNHLKVYLTSTHPNDRGQTYLVSAAIRICT